MLWVTGDLYGGDSDYHISRAWFKPKSVGIFAFVVGIPCRFKVIKWLQLNLNIYAKNGETCC